MFGCDRMKNLPNKLRNLATWIENNFMDYTESVNPVTGMRLYFSDCPYECDLCLRGEYHHIAEDIKSSITKRDYLNFKPSYRHKKRGTSYENVAYAFLQTEKPIVDGVELKIYRDITGKVWARPVEEFFDGRFEVLEGGI